MSVRRVAVLVGLCVAMVAAPASGAREVGFANLAGSEAESSIEAARGQLGRHGYKPVQEGSIRAALEEPLPQGSGATPALGRARQHLAAAREAYADFEYDRAAGALEQIDELLLDREPSQPVIEILIQRHLLAGQMHESRDRPDEAVDSFRLVRHLDPSRTSLDPGEYRPRVVSLYKKARPGRANATLSVTVTPAGAQVWIDGRSMGRAPVEATGLAPGRHWVVVSALGRSPRGKLVDVSAGKQRSLELDLKKRPAAERIAEVRRELASASSRDELEAGAAELAGAAAVDVMVLVRGQGDAVEGAAFDTARGELGAWAPLPSRGFWLVLTPGRALPEDGEGGGGGPVIGDGARDDGGEPSWYQTGWGKGVIIGGAAAVVAGTVLYFVLTGGEDTYTIGGWCFEEGGCQ
ncbi:MAG TPA: PEGA domain-containing protein [Kofleriaceae bacterium]|nr:PEGA domain-containing protein [Kofleriaceae bacterium]